jgi:hypothetical protein
VGTKKKGGREVPNCVPIKKSEHSESEDFRQIQMGGDLLVDVECDTNLPLSTPAELREAKMRKRMVAAQNKAKRQEAREQAKRLREAKRATREAKRMQQGFAEEMKRKPLIAGPSAGSPSFAESEEDTLDFTRCQRSDGSFYGTGGTCRTGRQATAKEEREGRAAATLKRIADRGPETKVKKESYSWGDLITVSKGNEFKAVLHPEHQDALKKLKDGEKTTFTDEQKVKWNATRTGDSLELKSGSKSLTMSASTLNTKDAQSPKAGQKMPGLPQRRPEDDVKRKSGQMIGTSPRNMAIDGLNELKKEAADYKKKFGGRANEESIGKILKMYDKRVSDMEKAVNERYGDN